MQRSDVGKIVEFRTDAYGHDAYGVVMRINYDVMLQPSKERIIINKDETIPTGYALIQMELNQLDESTKYATRHGTIESKNTSGQGTFGPKNKPALVTYTPAPNPDPEQGGGKRARKSRKVRKSRNSHKKSRKSRKARKSRRRARR
jgi:hypothetical protein